MSRKLDRDKVSSFSVIGLSLRNFLSRPSLRGTRSSNDEGVFFWKRLCSEENSFPQKKECLQLWFVG